MRLTADVIVHARASINPCDERELDLRGYKIPMIENLGVTQDQFDAIDFSDNEIKKLDNFPRYKRLSSLLLCNNHVSRIALDLGAQLPSLSCLILTNNKLSALGDLKGLGSCKKLTMLSLLHNEVVNKQYYRLYTINLVPSLKQLDFQKVTVKEREAAGRLARSQAGQMMMKDVAKQAEKAKTFTPGAPAAAEQKLTDEHRAIYAERIAKATTVEEIEMLSKKIQAGIIPSANYKQGGGGGGGSGGGGAAVANGAAPALAAAAAAAAPEKASPPPAAAASSGVGDDAGGASGGGGASDEMSASEAVKGDKPNPPTANPSPPEASSPPEGAPEVAGSATAAAVVEEAEAEVGAGAGAPTPSGGQHGGTVDGEEELQDVAPAAAAVTVDAAAAAAAESAAAAAAAESAAASAAAAAAVALPEAPTSGMDVEDGRGEEEGRGAVAARAESGEGTQQAATASDGAGGAGEAEGGAGGGDGNGDAMVEEGQDREEEPMDDAADAAVEAVAEVVAQEEKPAVSGNGAGDMEEEEAAGAQGAGDMEEEEEEDDAVRALGAGDMEEEAAPAEGGGDMEEEVAAEEEEEAEPKVSASEIKSFKVAELKKKLVEMNLPTDGLKAALQARLLQAFGYES